MKMKLAIHDTNNCSQHQNSETVPRRKVLWDLLIKVVCAAAILFSAPETRAGATLTTLCAFTNVVYLTHNIISNGLNIYTDDQFPQGELIFGSDGSLYGTTSGGVMELGVGPYEIFGNTYPYGSVFQINSNGVLTNLFEFGLAVVALNLFPPDGAGSSAGLIAGNDGNFYGTTVYGGTNENIGLPGGSGTFFRITPGGTMTVLHRFDLRVEGTQPVGRLVLGSDGFFYGMTFHGPDILSVGAFAWATVFKVDTNGALTTLYKLTNSYTLGGLIQGSDGYIYGSTYNTLFKISTNGEFSTLHTFTGDDGSRPAAPLVQASDGYFYGTTWIGGTSNLGTVFKMDTNGTFTSLYSFTGANADANPCGALIQATDGYLYGTTSDFRNASTNGPAGNVFQISTNGNYTSIYSFPGGNDGWVPAGGLVQGSDGSFYGTTEYAGQYGGGTAFRLTVMPTLQSAIRSDSVVNFIWSAEKGGRYQLQCTSDLGSGNWVNMGNSVISTGPSVSLSDNITNSPQRFYRLMPVLN